MATSTCASGCTQPSDTLAALLQAPAPCGTAAAVWERVPRGVCTEEGVLGLPTATPSKHLGLKRCQPRLRLFS